MYAGSVNYIIDECAEGFTRKGVMEGRNTDTAGACLELANVYQDQLMDRRRLGSRKSFSLA